LPRQTLHLLLVLILALQSVIAAADAHQLHQAETAHHVLNGEEHPSIATINPASSEEGNEQKHLADKEKSSLLHKCSHCCHCHGSMLFLSTPAHHFINSRPSLDHTVFSSTFVSWLTSPEHRPPIV